MEVFMNYLSSLPGAVAQGIIWGIMAIGVYITYKVLDVADLTVDGSICTGAAVCATLLTLGHSMAVAVIGAIIAGMLAGLITGIFHTKMGIPAILAGILTQLMLWTINLKIMGVAVEKPSVANVSIPSRKFNLLVSFLKVKESLIVLGVFVVMLIGILYWFFGTEFGASVRSTGSNPEMSRAQGININFTKIIGLMISNGIVAFSGALLAQLQGNSDINMGKGAIVIGLAAVIIGDALFGKITKSNFALKLLSVIFGGIIYYVVCSTVIYFGLDTNYLKLLTALVVAVFLAVPYLKSKYFPYKMREKSKSATDENKSGTDENKEQVYQNKQI